MKVFLDACALDWLIDDPSGPRLLVRFRTGEARGVVSPEVSKEIHATPDEKAERRARLLNVLQRFLPVQLSLVPVAGLARSGACRSAPSGARELREELKNLGIRKLDVLHLMNAHYSRCDVFLTTDREDIIRRKDALERRLRIEILQPSELLDRLEGSLPSAVERFQ